MNFSLSSFIAYRYVDQKIEDVSFALPSTKRMLSLKITSKLLTEIYTGFVS